MTSIGDTLRRERQKRNLDIAVISHELKIAVRFLEAMEQDDLSKLPGGVFTKSFIRQYAGYLGLDGEEMVAELERDAHPEPPPDQMETRPKPNVPVIDVGMGNSWQSVSDRREPLPSWLRAGVMLIVLTLICSGAYWWWQKPHRPAPVHEPPVVSAAAPAPQAAPPAASTPVEPPVGTSTTPAIPESTPAAKSTAAPAPATPGQADSAPATASAPTTPPANPNATVRISITADEPVWVQAVVNGKVQIERILDTHESRNIDADGEVKVKLGNAGGVTITLNGKPIGPVGPKGQVRTVQFTSGGFQIVSPPIDPLDRL